MSKRPTGAGQKTASPLSKLSSSHGQWLQDPSGEHVFHVTNPHVLTQAVGYVKFVVAQAGGGRVLVRGQEALYPTLVPSLYRQTKSESGKRRRDHALAALLKNAPEKWLGSVPAHARQALLQHYGIRTNWLDVVDNVWIALWFACHSTTATGRRNEFVHFDPRRPSGSGSFAYILLIRADDGVVKEGEAGLLRGSSTELLDLRLACPSHYVRPHAQHGLLVRRAGAFGFAAADYQDLVAGIVRVDLADAFSWLGDGKLLSVRALFPPPTFDFGYRILLDKAPVTPEILGAICIVGA